MGTISGIQLYSTAVILYYMVLGCFHTKIKLRSFIQQRDLLPPISVEQKLHRKIYHAVATLCVNPPNTLFRSMLSKTII